MRKISIISKANKNTNTVQEKKMDFGMFAVIMILLCIGIVMVSSASSYYALSTYSNSNYFLSKQLILAIAGVVAMLIISKIDYRKYKKYSYLFYIVSLLLLIAVLFIGQERKGATRWLGFGSNFSFQPSEIMKIAIVFASSCYLSKNFNKLTNLKGYFVPFIYLMLVMVIMYFQNHLSGTLVMIIATISIIFASGIKLNLKWISAIILIGGVAVSYFILSEDFRKQRVLSFLHPEEGITEGNWQAAQSLYAIGSGGIFGRGLGQSRQKYLWLPEAQNDFIFSVLGEEFGLLGTTIVLLLFIFFIYRGYRIAINSQDMYASLLVTGIISVFALQIIINVAVVTSSIPVTGMPLPFFSYGGTSLFINLCAMGIVLNISRFCKN